MSTARKLGASVAAVLLTAGIGLTASAPAEAGSSGVEARTVLPFVGHYQGYDGHHRHVYFYFDGHSIQNFKVNHQVFLSGAPVQGHQVHHYCNNHTSKCIRGHWSWDTTFVGVWNDPRQGGDVSFTATLYAH